MKLNSLPTVTVSLKKPDNPEIKAYEKAVERGMNSQYVIPKNGKWIVKKVNDEDELKVFDTESEAVTHAKKTAENQGTAVFIQNNKGQIQKRFYYHQ